MILDGGFSTELEKFGIDIDKDPLWGAGLLKTNTQIIVEIHKRYILAGSETITTASYQATVEGFVQHLNVSIEEALQLISNSVKLAEQAVASANQPKSSVRIAGSVGPYGVVLHDGSEYHGDYVDTMSIEELMAWHRSRVQALVSAGVNLLAFETIPAQKEALALVRLLREFPNTKAWISFNCKDVGTTAHGEPYQSAVDQCLHESWSPDQIQAIGVNCVPPDIVMPLIRQAKAAVAAVGRPPIPLVVYPNSGEKWTTKIGWSQMKVFPPLSSYAPGWFQEGATWIGGCCRTGPEDIALLKQALIDTATIVS